MIDERLLLASALVHARPGGQLSAVDATGREVVVGRHPSADVDPCRWRTKLVDSLRGRCAPVFDGLTLAGLGGSLEPTDVGAFIDRNDLAQRWFAVRLSPCAVVDTLRSVVLEGLPQEAVMATVRPDPELGVTVVGTGVDSLHLLAELDRLAVDVAGALVVAELCATLPLGGS